jgi:hypothetical protein
MIESLQLPVLIAALAVMSWAVARLSWQAKPSQNPLEIPVEVLHWQAELRNLSQELQAELDEKMAAVSALSQAYEQATERLSDLIQLAERVEQDLETQKQLRLSA